MLGDSSGRSRSALLTRWRGALRLVPELDSPSLVQLAPSDATPTTPAPIAKPPIAPAMGDEVALFNSFEAEVRRALARPTADRLLALLDPARTAVLSERNEATCAACLAQLDLLEDVLDALLLVEAGGGEAAPGAAPR